MRRLLLSAACVLALLSSSAQAQVYMGSGVGGPIADGGPTNGTPGIPLVSTATIMGGGMITGVSVSFDQLAHTWAGDLTLVLTHPNGVTSMDIQSRPGRGSASSFGFSSDYVTANTYSFSDNGAMLFDVAPPATIASGDYLPSSNPNPPATNLSPYVYTPTSFATTFGGLDSAGIWTLTATDWASGDTGSFVGWTLTVDVTPIPEPTSMALCGMVVGGLAWAKRRKNKVG